MLLFLVLVISSCALGGTPVTLPLLGNYSQLFFYYTEVGVAGVTHKLTVDTGSADLWLNAAGCSSCFGGQPSSWYNVSASSTGKKVACGSHLNCNLGCDAQCSYSVTYGGSLTVDSAVNSDVVDVPSYFGTQTRVDFGAAFNVSQGGVLGKKRQDPNSFPDGLWGLGFAELNELKTIPLLDALMETLRVPDIFAMCLQPVGGLLEIGAATPFQEAWKFTRIPKKRFYSVHMQDVRVGGMSLGFPAPVYNTPCIVDSGTPFPTIPVGPFGALKAVFFKMCASSKLHGICDVPSNSTLFQQGCFRYTSSQVKAFPTISFHMDGVVLDYAPSDYLTSLYYCAPGERGLAMVSDPQFTVIGATLLQQYAVAYDRKNMRLGFSRSGGKCQH